jgi:predicted phage terminase large subunit-like protein
MNGSLHSGTSENRALTKLLEEGGSPDGLYHSCLVDNFHAFVVEAWPHVDPDPFIDGPHIKVLCSVLERVTRGELTRVLVNIPPRSSKSLLISVLWPAWCWAQPPKFYPDGKPHPLSGPRARFISASYDEGLSTRDNLKMRNLILSPWYRRMFPHVVLDAYQGEKTRYNTTAGGFRQSTSVRGMATGEGGDALIIDDPNNVKQAESPQVRDETNRWFREVLPSRLNNRDRGAIITVMQRVHERDVAGYILSSGLPYEHVCLPALYEPDHPYVCKYDWRTEAGQPLWPDRPGFDVAGIEQLALEMGSYAAAGQLQQRPAPRGGGMFKEHWFPTVDAMPAKRVKVRAWDLAATVQKYGTDPDWTVGVLMSRDEAGFFTIEDVIRLRGGPAEVERAIRNTALLDGKDVRIRLPQDPGQAGKAQAGYLIRTLAGFNARAVPPTGSKETRAGPFAAQAEAGNVRLLRAPWNRIFLDEMTMFPAAAHDDQVDAATDAFNELASGPAKRAGSVEIRWQS